jgi:hypothetical protein
VSEQAIFVVQHDVELQDPGRVNTATRLTDDSQLCSRNDA